MIYFRQQIHKLVANMQIPSFEGRFGYQITSQKTHKSLYILY